jgi:hypothetical protein
LLQALKAKRGKERLLLPRVVRVVDAHDADHVASVVLGRNELDASKVGNSDVGADLPDVRERLNQNETGDFVGLGGVRDNCEEQSSEEWFQRPGVTTYSRMKKIALALVAALALSGCFRPSQNVIENISVHADRFEVMRRITIHDHINNTDRVAVEGYCAWWPEPTRIKVVCKVGGQYVQEHFGLSPYVTYSVEQLEPITVATNRREH